MRLRVLKNKEEMISIITMICISIYILTVALCNFAYIFIGNGKIANSSLVIYSLIAICLFGEWEANSKFEFVKKYGYIWSGVLLGLTILNADWCTIWLIMAFLFLGVKENVQRAMKELLAATIVLEIFSLGLVAFDSVQNSMVMSFLKGFGMDIVLMVAFILNNLPQKVYDVFCCEKAKRVSMIIAIGLAVIWYVSSLLVFTIDFFGVPIQLSQYLTFSHSGISILQLIRIGGLDAKIIYMCLTVAILGWFMVELFCSKRYKDFRLWICVALFVFSVAFGGLITCVASICLFLICLRKKINFEYLVITLLLLVINISVTRNLFAGYDEMNINKADETINFIENYVKKENLEETVYCSGSIGYVSMVKLAEPFADIKISMNQSYKDYEKGTILSNRFMGLEELNMEYYVTLDENEYLFSDNYEVFTDTADVVIKGRYGEYFGGVEAEIYWTGLDFCSDKLPDADMDNGIYVVAAEQIGNIGSPENYRCIAKEDNFYILATGDELIANINQRGIKSYDFSEMMNAPAIFEGVDYSPVYDYYYYVSNNPDVYEMFGDDSNAVLDYFVKEGIDKGQVASTSFDPQKYKDNYADLSDAFGDAWRSYYEHYMFWGITEGRVGN